MLLVCLFSGKVRETHEISDSCKSMIIINMGDSAHFDFPGFSRFFGLESQVIWNWFPREVSINYKNINQLTNSLLLARGREIGQYACFMPVLFRTAPMVN